MKDIIKNINITYYEIKETKIGYCVISFLLKIYYFPTYYLLTDKMVEKIRFKKEHKRILNLNNPQTLNEKIIWLKLYDRTYLHTICADKYAVRDYVKEKIGEEYLVPLYYQTKKVKNIIPENLPNPPFIIKANHDSDGGIFVFDKSKIDWQEARISLKKRLKKSFYPQSKEWQYKNINPCIIVEKLLISKNGNIPYDYKIHCFNGKVNMIQVDIDRNSDHHYRNWYNTKWEREPYKWSSLKWSSLKGKEVYTDPSESDVDKPNTLEQMIFLSEKLASEFCYVRVDWYDVDDVLYFGELTFHHDGGYRPIIPKKWDKTLGDKLALPTSEIEIK